MACETETVVKIWWDMSRGGVAGCVVVDGGRGVL